MVFLQQGTSQNSTSKNPNRWFGFATDSALVIKSVKKIDCFFNTFLTFSDFILIF